MKNNNQVIILLAWLLLVAGCTPVVNNHSGVWTYGEPGSPIFHHAVEEASPESIAAELNILLTEMKNPLVILKAVESSTIRVSLSDDAMLTQRMGSSGAQSYLQIVVYSFSSLPGIDCVDFQFEEGDHAQPGLYCRDSW